MALTYDPELAPLLTRMRSNWEKQSTIAKGDALGLRRLMTGSEEVPHTGAGFLAKGAVRSTVHTFSRDGMPVTMYWYTHEQSDHSGAAVLYFHGGGMIAGSATLYDNLVSRYVAATGVPFLNVEYRLAPELPYPAPIDDCFSALEWLLENATHYKIDPQRIAVMGDSAGGGLAAAVALKARDEGILLKKQLLIYPMLDNRTVTPDPELQPLIVWGYAYNAIAWQAYLGKYASTEALPPYAVPALADNLKDLPPAYIEVGDLDIFRDEAISYAARLARSGSNIELLVRPGCPHGFDTLPVKADVIERAFADRFRVIAAL
ncbi:MAG: alpha/beta hydrolase [Tannerellaceae bacterium]|nr:alpha/beta hydrolase [Tannerellaceae bacterium]